MSAGHDEWCRAADPALRDSSMADDCICERLRGARADERKQIVAEYVPVLMEDMRIWTDLRAKVKALITPQGVGSWNSALEAVLDLIDGRSE